MNKRSIAEILATDYDHLGCVAHIHDACTCSRCTHERRVLARRKVEDHLLRAIKDLESRVRRLEEERQEGGAR